MKSLFRIAEISFGSSHWDASFQFTYDRTTFDVQRFGCNFSVAAAQFLIKNLQNEVDAFALTSMPPTMCFGNQSFIHRQYFQIMNTPSSVPICDGTGLREISNFKSIIELLDKNQLKTKNGIFFPAALLNIELAEFLRHHDRKCISFGDLYSIFGLPFVVKPFLGLMSLTKLGLHLATIKEIKSPSQRSIYPLQEMGKSLLHSQISNYQTIVADLPLITHFGKNLDFFKGKDIIIWSKHKGIEKHIQGFGINKIHQLLPQELHSQPYMNYPVLEAALRLTHKRESSLNFTEWQELLSTPNELIQIVKKYSQPRRDSSQVKISRMYHKTKSKLTNRKEPDFAFVVHALSHRDFERVPGVGSLVKSLPKNLNESFDQMVARLPPIVYGQVKHVISQATGKEVNGIIYTLFATPKVLKMQDPEITYAQIQKCCEDAAQRGAKIIGLGAYTKVVGDSGVTINKNSPLPVTTGNSLSASATLWGLHDVIKRMGLLETDPNTGKFNGSVMVIGSTGSIGKVSAKLLCMVFKKVYLVAPRLNRLHELTQELLLINPDCQIICTSNANEFAGVADALVTATSAVDQKIVDVMKLKPGCVVCDCSRPLDFSKEDAKKRPDVIIIESGELILPGPYEITCDMGLPGNTVYACLAETCVLAMEEKYDSFTLGRDIDWNKVKEIYQLSRKHGVKLASIQGHMGTLTDLEIRLARELALSRRAENLRRS